jgi:hypothetical protein
VTCSAGDAAWWTTKVHGFVMNAAFESWCPSLYIHSQFFQFRQFSRTHLNQTLLLGTKAPAAPGPSTPALVRLATRRVCEMVARKELPSFIYAILCRLHARDILTTAVAAGKLFEATANSMTIPKNMHENFTLNTQISIVICPNKYHHASRCTLVHSFCSLVTCVHIQRLPIQTDA